MSLHSGRTDGRMDGWMDGIIAYEHASHPSNINNLDPLYVLGRITGTPLIMGFKWLFQCQIPYYVLAYMIIVRLLCWMNER